MTWPTKVLSCVDREGAAVASACVASAIAEASDSELHVLHVLEQTRRPWTHTEPLHEALLAEICEVETTEVRSALAHTTKYHWRQGHPVKEILAGVKEIAPDLLVLGRPHEGLIESLVGGTATGVLRRTETPVLVHKTQSRDVPKNLLACIDMSETSLHALDVAIDLAKTLGAGLRILCVFEPPAFCYDAHGVMPNYAVDHIMKDERAALDARLANVDWKDVPWTLHWEVGMPAATILDVAESEKVDLVLVGSHGRTGFDRVFMGSVSEYVVRHGTVSVLVVRPPHVD